MNIVQQGILAALVLLLVIVLTVLLASARQIDAQRRREGLGLGDRPPAARLRDVELDESDFYR